MPNDFLATLITFGSGGMAGALITAYATNIRNRRELALKLADRYIAAMFEKVRIAREAMESPTRMADHTQWNSVVAVANWYELVASCYLNGSADGRILTELGLIQKATDFYQLMRNAKQTQDGQQVPAFDEDTLGRLKKLQALVTGATPYSAY